MSLIVCQMVAKFQSLTLNKSLAMKENDLVLIHKVALR